MQSFLGQTRRLVTDTAICLRFYTRLPVPRLPFETSPFAMPDFTKIVRMLPVAGALVGMIGALTLALALQLHLPAPIAATLALVALVATTGAMHEDGLADCADGFGGGSTVARKLEIMKDSRIGTYGGVALVLSLVLRVLALADLAGHGAWLAGLVLIASTALSRALGLLPLALLPPARADGAGFAAGQPSMAALRMAGLLAAVLACLPMLAGMPFRAALAGIICAGLAAYGVVRLALGQIGGQTGDVAGAAQQIAEITFLLAVLGNLG